MHIEHRIRQGWQFARSRERRYFKCISQLTKEFISFDAMRGTRMAKHRNGDSEETSASVPRINVMAANGGLLFPPST